MLSQGAHISRRASIRALTSSNNVLATQLPLFACVQYWHDRKSDRKDHESLLPLASAGGGGAAVLGGPLHRVKSNAACGPLAFFATKTEVSSGETKAETQPASEGAEDNAILCGCRRQCIRIRAGERGAARLELQVPY